MTTKPDQRNKSAALRLLGRSLIAIFCVSILAAALPIRIKSAEWGIFLSNRIADNALLALAGVGLLRYAAFIDIHGEVDDEEDDDVVALQRDQASRFLAKLGAAIFAAVALWQSILFFGILSNIDRESSNALTQISQRTAQFAEVIKKAPESDIQRLLQESRQALGNRQRLASPNQRQELADNIRLQESDAINSTKEGASQARFRLSRDTARILLLCLIYAVALFGLATVF